MPPSKSALRQDTTAALINAVVSVPDGLASAALAGVNPVSGLYTSIAAPIGGSLLASAQLMQVSTTSAAALAAGQAVAAYPETQRAEAMFLLTVLTGLGLLAFGLLRLGRLVRFVSHALMTGFLSGVAVVLVLDQLAPLLGTSPAGSHEVTQFVDLLSRSEEFDSPTIVVGVLALALSAGLARTRVATFSSLVALVVLSLLVALLGWQSVSLVSDVSVIPRGLPMPRLYLSGVHERLATQLRRAGKLDFDRAVHLVPALDVLGASTLRAIEQAGAWLGSARGEHRPATTLPDG